MGFEGVEGFFDLGVVAVVSAIDVENVFPVFLFGGVTFSLFTSDAVDDPP